MSSSGTTKFSRGTSYVSSHHPHSLHLRYFGKAYAAGNTYQGKKIVSASFRYYRTSRFNSGWKTSYAKQSANCSWSPGAVKEYSVFDSFLGGSENTTRFAYKFGVPPVGAC